MFLSFELWKFSGPTIVATGCWKLRSRMDCAGKPFLPSIEALQINNRNHPKRGEWLLTPKELCAYPRKSGNFIGKVKARSGIAKIEMTTI